MNHRRLTWILMRKSVAAECDHSAAVRHGHYILCPDCGRLEGCRTPYRVLSLEQLAKATVDWRNNPNYRWITIHPHGNSEGRGVPVLVKVNPDGTAHVVGGAGGSLNYKVLTQIRSPEEYALEARVRREEKRNEQRAREAALPPKVRAARQEARQTLAEQQAVVRAQFLERVSRIAGWTEGVSLPEEVARNIPPRTRERLEAERERRLLRKAEEVVRNIESQVVQACNEQAAAGLGDVAVSDLDTRAIDSSGNGYVLGLEDLAAESGYHTQEGELAGIEARTHAFEVAEEAGFIKSAAAVEAAVQKFMEGAARARMEDAPYRRAGLHQPQVEGQVEDPRAMREALMAYQEYKTVSRQLEKAERDLMGTDYRDAAEVPAGVALVPEVPPPAEIARQVEESLVNRVMVEAADSFLAQVYEHVDSREDLQRHVQMGRYAQMAEVAQTMLGQEMPFDRHVADILGNEGTATLLAYYLAQNMTPEELAVAKQTLAEWHEKTQVERARAAQAKADEELRLADEATAGLPAVGECDAVGLQALAVAEGERRKHLGEAQRILGTALGRLEAVGELNSQLRGMTGPESLPASLTVSLGQISTKQAVMLGHALGLRRYKQDFDITSDGPNKYLHIGQAVWDQLLAEPDREVAELYEDIQAIRRGEEDEDGWLPAGIERRALAEMTPDYERAFHFSVEPDFRGLSGEPLRRALRQYVGRSLAENGAGSLDEIRHRVLSAEFLADHLAPEQRREFQEYAAELLPANLTKSEKRACALADELVAEATAGDPERQALDNQTIAVTDNAYEALHQALATFPVGRAAFTPLAGMSETDKEAIRTYFWDHMAKWGERPNAAATRAKREEIMSRLGQVVREETDLFGETHQVTWGETEEGKAALAALEEGQQQENPWEFYCRMMGGVEHAYRGVQEEIRGRLLRDFAEHYRALTGVELKTGQAPIHKAIYHWIGTMDEEAYRRFTGGLDPKTREQLDELRGRRQAGTQGGGQYTSGSVKKLLANIEAGVRRYNLQRFAGQQQLPSRLTIGRTAEAQVQRIWSQMQDSFDPHRPVKVVHDVSMSGKYAHQQRAIKCIERAKRQLIAHSTGSGKSLVGIGAFTDLHRQGRVRRGIYIVPPAIQEQFGSEMLKYTTPGAYRFWANSRGSAEERRRAYADPNLHMVAVSHQAFRDDLTWAVAQDRFGGDVQQAAQFLRTAPEEERTQAVRAAVQAQKWDGLDYVMVDEGHDALNRKGKPNSRLANVIDAFTAGVPYYVNATATPVKNDASEVYDLLRKMRPDKYPASGREEFMRRYGLDTRECREALQRLTAPYLYPRNVDTGVVRHVEDLHADLTPKQQQAYREVIRAYQTARRAPRGSKEWRQAMIKLTRPEELEGLSREEADRFLERRSRFLANARDNMLNRIIHGAREIGWEHTGPILQVLDYVRRKKTADHDGGMEPGLIFAVHHEVADMLTEALRAHGYRVGQLDGRVTGHEVEQRRLGFHPVVNGLSSDPREAARQKREAAQYDVLVCTDSASMGLNLDRGRWLLHHELPWTAKTHAQRQGRIDRLSQDSPNVEMGDVVTDTPLDHRKRELLGDKYDLTRTFMEDTELLDDSGLALMLRRNLSRAMREGAHELTAGAV